MGCAGAVSAQVWHISFCSKLDRPPVLMKDWAVAVVGASQRVNRANICSVESHAVGLKAC